MTNAAKVPGLENDAAWDTGALGDSEEHAKPAPEELERMLDEVAGVQMISIRLSKQTIEGFKYIASREGLRYQTLMKQILHRFVVSEMKRIANEMATNLEKQAPDALIEVTRKVA